MTQDGNTWHYQGTAQVTLDMQAVRTLEFADPCPWAHGGQFEVPFKGQFNTILEQGTLLLRDGAGDVSRKTEIDWDWLLQVNFTAE